jgi:hypothetical protein
LDTARFDAHWTNTELKLFSKLDQVVKIQAFLDEVPYSCDPIYRSPRSVIRDRKAHCMDGALFAAAALRRLGYPPLIVNLYAVRDDDHMLAIFKRDGFFGAIAKSNFTGLRFREPLFRSLRELVLSYFEDYFNLDGEKSLRAYSAPLNLQSLDRLQWMTSDKLLNRIPGHTDRAPRRRVVTPKMVRNLLPVDARRYKAALLGSKRAGLYKP